MKKFYLIDYDHNKAAKKQDKLYMMAAKIALKYGRFGNRFCNVDDVLMEEFWEGDDCPSFSYFLAHVKVSVVKWYIHNRITLPEGVWNADFLHGMVTAGDINWCKYCFPTLTWRQNKTIYDLLKTCGFGGRLRQYNYYHNRNNYRWMGAPALYLKYSKNSISFMAGLLASAVICEEDGVIYARYNKGCKEYFKRWSIPIEKEDKRGFLWVSPIWGALFAPRMPEQCWKIWYDLKNPYGMDIYPPILWKTYVNNQFPTRGIPYLKSRRWIFNHYKTEQGAMKTLEKERVNRNLTQVDKRIREMVHEWDANLKEGIGEL
jgi:hypothetical protein